jgi:hypothetical protein
MGESAILTDAIVLSKWTQFNSKELEHGLDKSAPLRRALLFFATFRRDLVAWPLR